ncbi:MAG: hypothetical protein ACRDCB_10990, partial [Clostridium sp.]
QGVSGYFKEYEVGAYLNKNKKDNIDKILNLINNYERLCCTALKKSKEYKWEIVSNRYKKMYEAIKNNDFYFS